MFAEDVNGHFGLSPLAETLRSDRPDSMRDFALMMVDSFNWQAWDALAAGIVAVAERVGERQVGLSGGCFQNRYLCEQTIAALRAAGFEVYWHRHVPPNDGALALGQAAWVARCLRPGAA